MENLDTCSSKLHMATAYNRAYLVPCPQHFAQSLASRGTSDMFGTLDAIFFKNLNLGDELV